MLVDPPATVNRASRQAGPTWLVRGAGPAVVLGAAAAMLAWTRGAWSDLLVDFGRELYVPWRLAEGDVLYRDVAYFNGPLSPYLNALAFRTFGVGLRTLVVCNLAILALIGLLLHVLLVRLGDRFSAAVAGVVFVTCFALSLLDGVGNDNYVTPYSHEITHGLALALLAVFALSRRSEYPHIAMLCCGLALGGTFLTKPEVFVAAAASVAAGLASTRWAAPEADKPRLPALGTLALAASLPPLAAFLLLAQALPAADALGGALGAWAYVFDTELTMQPFYRSTLGTDRPLENLRRALVGAALVAAFLVALVGLAFVAGRSRLLRVAPSSRLRWLLLAPLVLTLPLLSARLPLSLWSQALRPVPILVLVLLLSALSRFPRRRQADSDALASRIACLIFALALLAKIVLNVTFVGYAFVLAMPATLLLVTALLAWLPAWVARRGGSPAVIRLGGSGIVLSGVLVLLSVTGFHVRSRSHRVGSGPDAFRADERAEIVNEMIRYLDALPDRSATLAVMPHGVMINYLTRRLNPTGYVNFLPPELIMFGEPRIIQAFRERPPDYIALAQPDTAEFGYPGFGRGFGEDLLVWVERHYRPIRRFGPAPLRPGAHFGIWLLERHDF